MKTIIIIKVNIIMEHIRVVSEIIFQTINLTILQINHKIFQKVTIFKVNFVEIFILASHASLEINALENMALIYKIKLKESSK